MSLLPFSYMDIVVADYCQIILSIPSQLQYILTMA